MNEIFVFDVPEIAKGAFHKRINNVLDNVDGGVGDVSQVIRDLVDAASLSSNSSFSISNDGGCIYLTLNGEPHLLLFYRKV